MKVIIMIKISNKITLDKYELFIPKQIQFNSVFFDIETTGLSKEVSEIFIAGMLYYQDYSFCIEQLFVSKGSEEKELIQTISNVFLIKEYIITYNGNNFDIPFYLQKCKKYDVAPNLNGKILIDLFTLSKKLKSYLNLKNLKFKTVEKYLSIERQDQLSGKDIIKLNTSYRITPKQEYLELMLQHNYEDVANLPYVFKINKLINCDFFLNLTSPEYNIMFLDFNKITSNKNSVKFKISTFPSNNVSITINAFLYKLLWERKTGKIEFEIMTNEGFINETSKIKFIDLNKFGLSKLKKYLILHKNNEYNTKNLLLLSKLLILKHIN